jgi:predicted Zn-dependent peptidase
MLNYELRTTNFKLIKKSLRLCCSAVVLFAFAVNIFAQKETPPVGGQPKPFVFPAQESFSLPNGMKVTLVQYGSVPKVAFQAYVYTGTKDDAKGKMGVSDFAGRLLKENTKNRSGEQIAVEIAEMGGRLGIGVGVDSTNFSGEVLSEFDVQFLNLLADVMLNPNFKTEDLERLRANRLRNLAISRQQAGTQAWTKFRELIYPNHPFGQLNPSENEVKSVTLEDVSRFYDENYGASKTHLYVVGKFNSAAVKKAIETAFSSWKKGNSATRNVPTVNGKRNFATIDRPNSPQSTIYLGMPAPNPADADFIKFTVMDTILGGAFGSRITSNIRENKGYTYSPGSFMFTRYKTGFWIESADVTTQFTGASIKEILYEINRMKTEPVSDAELNGIKNYMTGLYVLQNSSRFGIIGQLETLNYYELPKSRLDNYVKEILTVTPKDIQDAANKYLTEDRMTLVVVGDLSKVSEQLKPYEK